MRAPDRRLLALGVGLPVLAAALAGGLGGPLDLAVGLALLVVAALGFGALTAEGGWARGALGTYAAALVTQGALVSLPFLAWFDVWLTTFVGFVATVSMVAAACLPYLDRRPPPDFADEGPVDPVEAARWSARPLEARGRVLLLVYSQALVVGNGLLVWHTIRVHG